MGYLEDGKWVGGSLGMKIQDGKFQRAESQFRNWITPDGSAGPDGSGGFKAEPGRYHLYVSWACPWAHRTLVFRKLKGLEDIIGLSVVNAYMGDDGWSFEPEDGVIPDPIHGAGLLRDVYLAADPRYSGRVTVPVVWDKDTSTIVSNESADIIRMFNSAFDDVGAKDGDYYPEELRADIDAVNARVYDTVNNGVYKSGFATSQDAYDEAVTELFDSLDWLEDILSGSRYLVGSTVTEADWRLFTTLVRFDAVYHGHFKCNLRRIVDYPNLSSYLRDLYQTPGVAETVNMDHIKRHYYASHEGINPTGIVPKGPVLDFDAPHGRDRQFP